MTWIDRPRLRASLRRLLDEPGPALVVVRGPPGSGRSGLLRRVLAATERAVTGVVGTAAPAERTLAPFEAALDRSGVERGDPPGSGWAAAVDALLRDLDVRRTPRILVFDDAPTLFGGAADATAALARLWAGVRARALPFHLVIVGDDGPALDALIDDALAGADAGTVRVGPVHGDELRRHLPDWSPADRYLIRACLGSSVDTLGRVDPGVRGATNVQRLVVDPDGILHGVPRRLRESVQKPERYAGILLALARGARDWGEIRRANPAFRSGNQLAPYLATLQDMGWIDVDRSLDAAPESRRRRYGLADPFLGFWYGVMEPALGSLVDGTPPSRLWRELPVDDHLARVFPRACLGVLAHRGDEILPVGSREAGGLWGDGYDLPVSGTLVNGAAVYGRCVWGRTATVDDADDALRHMRATRYGFGRQARLRLLFTSGGATEALVRRTARDPLLRHIPLSAMF